MASFQAARRDWAVNVTYGSVERVRAATGKNLVDEVLREDADLFAVVPLLVELLRPQLAEAGVDPAAFLDGLGGDELGKAVEALQEATIDFFPDPAKRAAMRKALATVRRIEGENLAKRTAILDDPAATAALLERWAKTRSSSASNAPASPASTPNPDPSASSSSSPARGGGRSGSRRRRS